MTQPEAAVTRVGADTVEAAVRAQLSKALGGRRGMLEAAVPTLTFTIVFLLVRDLKLAIVVSVAAAVVLLVARLVQRSTVQFVLNSLVGIAIGSYFAWRSARGGGDASDNALAYFLPGIIYNAGYALVMLVTIIVRWPVVGFMVGSVTGDPTAWHRDAQVVRLCRNLTWLLVAPCVVRVAVELPMYAAGRAADGSAADGWIAALGVAKIVLGWPLQIAALAAMAWLLARNHTPVGAEPAAAAEGAEPSGRWG
ncbi:MAG TPA: DUF3159 domain-containing protein [Nocardioidaceae bacterium]|nr:DUF3159 domain-containing protein [Nocardioidaceae bacterium]